MKFKGKERVLLIIMSVLLVVVLVKGVVTFINVLHSGNAGSSVSKVSAQEQDDHETENNSNSVKGKASVNNVNTAGDLNSTYPICSAMTIMLDPGHGADDPGTHSGGYNEKDIALDYTNELKTMLESYGFNVVLSRDPGVYITPKERAEYANELKVDLFVSVHCNYYEWDSSIAGFECYYSADSQEGRLMSESIADTIESHGDILSRGSKDNNFCVLVNTQMPAILVELGYMSNKEELSNLVDNTYMKKLVAEIAEGIYTYVVK